MWAFRSLRQCRRYATASGPHSLVFLEHAQGSITPGSLSALTAAQSIGGQVSALIVGSPEEVPAVLDSARRFRAVSTVLHSAAAHYSHPLPEVISPLFEKLITESAFTHVIGSNSSLSKSLLPRVAAVLGLPALSDITSLNYDSNTNTTTFTRPIYAGNAISTVVGTSDIRTKLFTVRSTAFSAASAEESYKAEAQECSPLEPLPFSPQHLGTTISKSDRPDLGSASRVVSGGRPLKDAETFQKTLFPLADVLGAAVGASRAAVDAGYADNSLQVGQTGKVVAPELYMAFGISGAIQHLAGMKDSKLIVAVNKDPDAPIFQVADVGLVGDLYEVIPQLVEKLKQ